MSWKMNHIVLQRELILQHRLKALIHFDSDNFPRGLRQPLSQKAGSGANFQHPVIRPQFREMHNFIQHVWVMQEILPQAFPGQNVIRFKQRLRISTLFSKFSFDTGIGIEDIDHERSND